MGFPAATPPPAKDDLAQVDEAHAMDGDGASLCERVDAGGLVTVDDFTWNDVPPARRCRACAALIG